MYEKRGSESDLNVSTGEAVEFMMNKRKGESVAIDRHLMMYIYIYKDIHIIWLNKYMCIRMHKYNLF